MRKILVVALACIAGTASAQWFNSFVSVPIPDGFSAGVDVGITVSGVGTILTDLNFGTVIEHTWQGDVVITLTDPSGGTTATLLNRAGTGGGGGIGFYADNFGNPIDPLLQANWFVLDDSAASVYDDPPVTFPGTNNVVGSWIPYTGTLAVFNGVDPNGVWIANFSDRVAVDSGTVLMAGVEIKAIPEPASMIALGLGVSALLARRRRKRA